MRRPHPVIDWLSACRTLCLLTLWLPADTHACGADPWPPCITDSARRAAAVNMIPAPPVQNSASWLAQATDASVDFLDLRGCALQATVRKQNSSLGRRAKPSQRLMLTLEYLRLAPACSAHMQQQYNIALAQRLEQRRLLQQQQLPELIFSATLGSAEYHAFWQQTDKTGQYPMAAPDAALAALQAINGSVQRWLNGNYRAQQRQFEVLLSQIAGGDGAVILRQENTQHGHALHSAIDALESQLARSLPGEYRSWQTERRQRWAQRITAQSRCAATAGRQ